MCYPCRKRGKDKNNALPMGFTVFCSLSGNDQAFQVTVGTAAVTSCTITFGTPFITTPPTVEITAANSTAGAGTTTTFVSSLTSTSMTITGTTLASASYYVQVK
jgi:hypothetical protein